MKPAEYDILFRVEDRHWWHRALRAVIALHWRRLVSAPRPRVLDAGCGTGGNLAALPPGAWSAGIDLSPQAVAHCRRRGLARTAVASAHHLPFAGAAFDVVISCDLLCHAGVDARAALDEMARVLEPGGLLLLNLPAYPWLLSAHDAAVSNTRRFTRAEVLALLRERGLTPLRATYWNTLLFPLIAPLRLWRKFRPVPHSDYTGGTAPWLAAALSALLALERNLLRLAPLPFGLSIFIAARKGSIK